VIAYPRAKRENVVRLLGANPEARPGPARLAGTDGSATLG
jgi:hypothetical protein